MPVAIVPSAVLLVSGACVHDFRVVIAREAVDSMDGEEMHRFALRLMAAATGWPLGTDEIFQALGR